MKNKEIKWLSAKDIQNYQNMGYLVWEIDNPYTSKHEVHILKGSDKEMFQNLKDFEAYIAFQEDLKENPMNA